MGIAILSGAELRFWGATRLRQKRLEELLPVVERRLQRLIRIYQPALLVVEKPTPGRLRSSPWLSAITARISTVALEAGLQFRLCDPAEVRERLCSSAKATRQDLASQIVAAYPHLGRYQKGVSPWQESYWLPMFAAVAVAVVCAQDLSSLPSAPRGAGCATPEVPLRAAGCSSP